MPDNTNDTSPWDYNGYDKWEVAALVFHDLIDEGLQVKEIRERLRDRYGVRISRQEVHGLIRFLGKKQFVKLRLPLEWTLAQQIRRKHPWLQAVRVVRTMMPEDVARHGAEDLLDLLLGPYAGREVVHVGFASGYTMRNTARWFADALRRPAEWRASSAGRNGSLSHPGGAPAAAHPRLPKTIVFHTVVAGFNVTDPMADAVTFCTYFQNDGLKDDVQVGMRFVVLHANSVVYTSEFDAEKAKLLAQDAYQSAKDLDVVVTSASPWTDEHSFLRNYMKRVPGAFEKLDGAGCVADMLWRPIGRSGPVPDAEIRAMTLLELSDLSRLVSGGKHVMLVLGPCRLCSHPRTEVLRTILSQPQKLISHLVVDSRTARDLIGAESSSH